MYQWVSIWFSIDIVVTNRLTIAARQFLSRQLLNCSHYYHVVEANVSIKYRLLYGVYFVFVDGMCYLVFFSSSSSSFIVFFAIDTLTNYIMWRVVLRQTCDYYTIFEWFVCIWSHNWKCPPKHSILRYFSCISII